MSSSPRVAECRGSGDEEGGGGGGRTAMKTTVRALSLGGYES